MNLEEKAREFAKHFADERKSQFPRLNPQAFDNESNFILIGYKAGYDAAIKQAVEIFNDESTVRCGFHNECCGDTYTQKLESLITNENGDE